MQSRSMSWALRRGRCVMSVSPARHDVLMTDPGPAVDDRHPADVVTGMGEHVRGVPATCPRGDGRPTEVPAEGEPPRIYTPHKAIRRGADYLVDHPSGLEARLGGGATGP